MSLYIFVLLSDSLFSEGMKNKIIYFWGHLPGETVFSRMKEKVKDIRFTQEQVLERYKSIYDNMPNQRDHKYRYENSAWYKIYNRYRDNKIVYVANRTKGERMVNNVIICDLQARNENEG